MTIGSVVLVGIVGLLTRGSRIVEVAQRTSSAQTDLRVILETLAADCEELIYLVEPEAYDSTTTTSGHGFRFVVRSARREAGVGGGRTLTLRQIEYAVEGATGDGQQHAVVRTVQPAAGSGTPPPPERRTLGRVLRLRVWPVAAVSVAVGRYNLALPTDPRAREALATVACVVVEASAGEASGELSADRMSVTTVATKLWCRNRMLELSRGWLK